MLRLSWKAVASVPSTIILLAALSDLGLAAGLTAGARPAFARRFQTAIGMQISNIQTLAPNSLASLRSLALSGGAGQLTSEQQAAQALLMMIASPNVGRLAEQPEARNALVPIFGEQNLGQIEMIAQRFHTSADADVQRTLAGIQRDFKVSQDSSLGIINVQANLNKLFEGSRHFTGDVAAEEVAVPDKGKGILPAAWQLQKAAVTPSVVRAVSEVVGIVPDQNYVEQALELIGSARESIDVLAFSARYAGAAKRVIDAIIAAKRSNPSLRVRFFMEGSRSTSGANRETGDRLEKEGITVAYGDTHAKGILVDGIRALVGSTNLTQTSIALNNETNVLITEEPVVRALSGYFQKRWDNPAASHSQSLSFLDGQLTLVLDSAYRSELLDMIRTSVKSLDISVYYLQLVNDDGTVREDMKDIADALVEARGRNVDIRIYLEQNGGDFAPQITARNRRSAEYLRSRGIGGIYFDLPDQISHSKYVIRDGVEFMLGTGNFNPADFNGHHQIFLRMKDPKIALRMTAHHSAKIAYESVRQPPARPYVRFWLGWLKPGLAQEDFDRAIDRVFVDATITTGRERGLHAYMPVLTRASTALTRNGRTFTVPTEIAAVIYDDPETYRAIRETPHGQVYGPLHGDFFDVTGQSGNRSQSAVPVLYAGQVQADRAYDLSAAGVNWQAGASHFIVHLRAEGSSLDDYLAGVKRYLDRRSEIPGLRGMAIHVTEDYVVEYANFDDEPTRIVGVLVLHKLKRETGFFDAAAWQSSPVILQNDGRTSISRTSATEAIGVLFSHGINREMIKRTSQKAFMQEPDLAKIKEEFLKGRR